MVPPDWLNYERQMRQNFDTLTTVGKLSQSIFKAYPLRVRTQQSITYYEIGARNITEDGEIVLLDEDLPKESANITAYEAQVLQAGDIIIPFRSKRVHAGLYGGSDVPMVPNPALLVVRSGSLLMGRYLSICLQQPFIAGYLEQLAQRSRKVELEDVANLMIPAMGEDFEEQVDGLDRIAETRRHLEAITQLIRSHETAFGPQVLAGRMSCDFERLDHLGVLLDETEELIGSFALAGDISRDSHLAVMDSGSKAD